jgi:hypothetical protein
MSLALRAARTEAAGSGWASLQRSPTGWKQSCEHKTTDTGRQPHGIHYHEAVSKFDQKPSYKVFQFYV